MVGYALTTCSINDWLFWKELEKSLYNVEIFLVRVSNSTIYTIKYVTFPAFQLKINSHTMTSMQLHVVQHRPVSNVVQK